MTMESRKEKVLEIAKRAGFVVDISGHGDRNADLHYNLDRFAELIVRDIHAYVDGMDTAQIISNGILRRYGVEL